MDVKEEVRQEESTEEITQEESTSTAESNTETLQNLTSDEYKEWRTSGKLPDKPAAKKTAAKPSESKPVVKEEKESAPSEEDEEEEEETPKPSKKTSRSEARKAELNEEIRTLANKRQEEERALNEILEKKKKVAEPGTKEEEKPKPLDKKALIAKIKARADKGEFSTYEEIVAATAEALIDERGIIDETKLQKMLKESMASLRKELAEEAEKKQSEQAVETQRRSQEQEWVKKVNEAEKEHPDFKEVCFAKDSPAARIKSGGPLDRAIMKNPAGALLLYHVCSIEGEVERINALDPDLDQPAEIKSIIQKLSGKKSKSDDEEETPPPPTTRAKKPPTEVNGRNSAVTDASETALKNKDYAGYAAAENAKEQARRKAALGKS